jgi:hypothetical protein
MGHTIGNASLTIAIFYAILPTQWQESSNVVYRQVPHFFNYYNKMLCSIYKVTSGQVCPLFIIELLQTIGKKNVNKI